MILIGPDGRALQLRYGELRPGWTQNPRPIQLYHETDHAIARRWRIFMNGCCVSLSPRQTITVRFILAQAHPDRQPYMTMRITCTKL